jgi:hypothetical protein
MATETKMYINDIGTIWRIDAGEYIADATTKQFKVKKPDGTEVTWEATVDSDLHTLTYTIVAGDYDQAGTYSAHAYIVTPSGQWTGELFKFKVYDQWK